MPPLLAGGVRFVLAGAVVYAVLLARRGAAALRVERSELVACAVVGTLLVTGGNGLVMVAEQDVPSALAALIIASVPLWVVLMRKLTGEPVAGGTLFGVGIGFVGVAILLLPGGEEGGGIGGFLLVVAAAVCWASGSFLSKRMPLPRDPFLSTALQMLIGGAVALVAGLAAGEAGSVHAEEFSTDSLLAFAYLITFGSLLAYTTYVWLLQHVPISKVATYAYVNPVIAILLGWLILSEDITAVILAGAAVIVASVAAIVRKESAPAE